MSVTKKVLLPRLTMKIHEFQCDSEVWCQTRLSVSRKLRLKFENNDSKLGPCCPNFLEKKQHRHQISLTQSPFYFLLSVYFWEMCGKKNFNEIRCLWEKVNFLQTRSNSQPQKKS